MANILPPTPQERFKVRYGTLGVSLPLPMVKQVLQNRHGIDNPVVDLDINKNKLRIIQPQGLVNGINDEFMFNPKPLIIVSDAATYRENHGWSFETDTATMDAAPSTDLFGLI